MRVVGSLAIALTISTPVWAQSQEDVLEAIGKCASVADDKARLACYDAAAPHVKQALAKPPETLGREPTKEEQQSWFGFNLSGLFGSSPEQQTTPQQFGSDKLPETHAKEEAASQAVESITSGVTEYAYNPFGKFIVFLDNGQIWKQEEGDSDHALFRKKATDNKVTISRGALGSYNLSINDSDKVYKAVRIK